VYIETTIPSYLTAQVSRDVVRLGKQLITKDWWATREQYELFISSLVVSECSAGDPTSAADRLVALAGIEELSQTDSMGLLAGELMRGVPLPHKAVSDATHIAIAAIQGINYLVTWNCSHIANAKLRP
jgi:hypothetical protein